MTAQQVVLQVTVQPVCSREAYKTPNIVQTSNVSEARGLIVDMLANRDLPPNVSSCLRAVASLLNPHT
ncbi:hypothetical protein COOONC_21869, partial [Cooperia oncophora]